ncbi:MAG TPA: hypothetical protein PK402_10555, partial [Tepidisphaeraceae bacterium]|nr:hypothetical protein [Tepidisphaeraceae bacterium]
MDSFKSRSMRGAILAGLAGLTLAGFGCEKQDGPAAWNAQQEANAERPRGAKAITTIKAKLDGIASDKGTGESVLAHATIADAEVLAASEPALDFRKSLDRSRQLAATIEDRAASAQRLLNAAASINARNPEQSITAIDGFKAAGNGDGNAATFTLGDNSLPSINALNQNISKLTSEIATREAEIAKLTDQRAKLLEKADKADRKSGTVERDERVKVVQQAADARNDAAKISSQIDGLNAQLLHLRADQKAEQAQLAALQEGIGWLDEQSAGLGAAWTEMNQHATGLTSKANTLLSTGESSVTELTAALEKEIAEADALLKQADEHFDLAVKSYNDAAGVAGTLASNFGTASEEGQTSSFKTLVEAFPRGRYDVNAAWTNLTRAKLHADYAAALADRKAVATSLANAAKASGYKVPDA